MKKLKKTHSSTGNTVEAYACACKSCSCRCFCLCEGTQAYSTVYNNAQNMQNSTDYNGDISVTNYAK